MRMTDETPRVNHSFALPACTFSDRQKPTLARQLAEPRIGQNGRANEGGSPPIRRTMKIGPGRPRNRL